MPTRGQFLAKVILIDIHLTGPSFKVDKSCLAKPNLLLPTSTSHSSVLDIRRALWLAVKVTGEIARPGAMWASFWEPLM